MLGCREEGWGPSALLQKVAQACGIHKHAALLVQPYTFQPGLSFLFNTFLHCSFVSGWPCLSSKPKLRAKALLHVT